MKTSKSTLFKLGSLACFVVGIERLAHGKTMGEGFALGLGCLAVIGGVLFAVLGFRSERDRK